MSYPCPGQNRVTDQRTWYIPAGQTARECTYCQECYNKFIRGTSYDNGFASLTNGLDCNCDFQRDSAKYRIQKNEIIVNVNDIEKFTMYLNDSFQSYQKN